VSVGFVSKSTITAFKEVGLSRSLGEIVFIQGVAKDLLFDLDSALDDIVLTRVRVKQGIPKQVELLGIPNVKNQQLLI